MAITDNLAWGYALDESSGNAGDVLSTNDLTDNGSSVGAGGVVGNYRAFDGSDDFLSHASATAFAAGDIDLCGCCWLFISDKSTARCAVAKGDGTNGSYIVQYDNSADRIRFLVYSGAGYTGNAQAVANDLGSPVVDTWYFVQWKHDAANNLIGIRINNGAWTEVSHSAGIYDSSSDFLLGGLSGVGQLWDGGIDEAFGWKRVLSDVEFNRIYNGDVGLAYPWLQTINVALAAGVEADSVFSSSFLESASSSEAADADASFAALLTALAALEAGVEAGESWAATLLGLSQMLGEVDADASFAAIASLQALVSEGASADSSMSALLTALAAIEAGAEADDAFDAAFLRSSSWSDGTTFADSWAGDVITAVQGAIAEGTEAGASFAASLQTLLSVDSGALAGDSLAALLIGAASISAGVASAATFAASASTLPSWADGSEFSSAFSGEVSGAGVYSDTPFTLHPLLSALQNLRSLRASHGNSLAIKGGP